MRRGRSSTTVPSRRCLRHRGAAMRVPAACQARDGVIGAGCWRAAAPSGLGSAGPRHRGITAITLSDRSAAAAPPGPGLGAKVYGVRRRAANCSSPTAALCLATASRLALHIVCRRRPLADDGVHVRAWLRGSASCRCNDPLSRCWRGAAPNAPRRALDQVVHQPWERGADDAAAADFSEWSGASAGPCACVAPPGRCCQIDLIARSVRARDSVPVPAARRVICADLLRCGR